MRANINIRQFISNVDTLNNEYTCYIYSLKKLRENEYEFEVYLTILSKDVKTDTAVYRKFGKSKWRTFS
ncbi:MAG TPA: hypothetical protein VKT28_15655, partial [Puia sp.]|nr:hypothetical protein [Puia sp.]